MKSRWRVLASAISLLILTAMAMVPVLAQQEVSPTDAMQQGNETYEAGDFTEAIAIYESIAAAGISNSDLYYNLGNAYFKQGDLGRAILNYRRAQRLAPRDTDVRANLNVARTQTIDKLDNADDGLGNLVQTAEQWLTINEAAVLALVLWVLICYFAVLAILLPKWRNTFSWVMVGLGIFLVIGVFSIANRLYADWQQPAAVIVSRDVDITSGPGGAGQYLVEFTLHSGTEVHVLERRPGWRRINLPGDLQGWAPAEAVEIVEQP